MVEEGESAPSLTDSEKQQFKHEIEIAEEVVEDEKKIWDMCREYYKGNHRYGTRYEEGSNDDDFSMVNMVYSNITTDMPRLAFNSPTWSLSARGTLGMDQDDLLERQMRASLAEELINYHADRDDFKKHQQLATLDAKLSLGVLKVFNKTQTKKTEETMMENGEPVMEDGEQVIKEKEEVLDQEFSVRRVKPEFFLVDPRCGNFLEDADWVAEKMPMRTERAQHKFNDNDIHPDVTFFSEEDDQGNRTLKRTTGNEDKIQDKDKISETMVYEVWDRANGRWFYMVNNSFYKVKRIPKEYRQLDSLPYVDLKFNEVPNKYYPIPDVWNEIPINQSYNMAKTALNSFRKMMIPKIGVNKGAFDDDSEIAKLRSRKTGQIIEMERTPDQAASFFDLPRLPNGILQTMSTDISSMDRISGISSAERGDTSGNSTATAASIAANNGQARSDWKRSAIIDTYTKIGKKLLKLLQQRMEIGGVIPVTGPAGRFWIDYEPEDIEGEFDFEVDFGEGSPADEDTQRSQLIESLQLVFSNPAFAQQFHLPRLAERLVDVLPGLDSDVLMPTGPQRQEQVLTMDKLIEEMKKGDDGETPTETGVKPPLMVPGEQPQGNTGGPNGQGPQGGQQGGQGASGGARQGQALNQFMNQAQGQAQGGMRGGKG